MTAVVIGAGLAGAEAAYALSKRGISVKLYEMKPKKFSPAHKYPGFAELVCSNSLKSGAVDTASGLLKAEMRVLGSVTLKAAEHCRVAAGGALAVDRTAFSDFITEVIKNDPNIEVISEEAVNFPENNAVIATGPLTSEAFAEEIKSKCGGFLSFYDAAAPIITAESIDMARVFPASRYGKGEADYLNCAMNKEQYAAFYNALVSAETAPLHSFENLSVYEGCMPVEVLAKRGYDALRFGCMKPVGLIAPDGSKPYAVVQLRKENTASTMYNLVGFQTNLKFGEQKRVFSLIPGLENAEYARYGVMHRNMFLNSPKLLTGRFKLKDSDNIYFAGQITGVEGYTESAASGIVAGMSLAGALREDLPRTTMIGALAGYISGDNADFQPMGANMGLLPPLAETIKNKRERYAELAKRALGDIGRYAL